LIYNNTLKVVDDNNLVLPFTDETKSEESSDEKIDALL